jgi:hypothetical protein
VESPKSVKKPVAVKKAKPAPKVVIQPRASRSAVKVVEKPVSKPTTPNKLTTGKGKPAPKAPVKTTPKQTLKVISKPAKGAKKVVKIDSKTVVKS